MRTGWYYLHRDGKRLEAAIVDEIDIREEPVRMPR